MKNTKTVQAYGNTAAAKGRSSEKNTRSGFADPIRIKNQNPVDQPKDGVKSPWDFTCPQYDQRSSNFVNAGTHYGIGHKQPIGHEGNPTPTAPTLPRNRMNTLQDDDLG
jgi:hypothetical protein